MQTASLAILAFCGLVALTSAVPTQQFLQDNLYNAPPVNIGLVDTNRVAPNGKLWALLIAGSNGWYNYRHQADICHSYQILRQHGIPDEQIVVMMYDDLAQNDENPTKGVVINHPNGSDVYAGVPKDYIGEDVTPANFLKVLKGDSQGLNGVGSGKVINSGPNDHVFVYFADHGAPGLIAFPSDELTAEALNDAITSMHQHNKYAKMVLYIEACESGSMFDKLLADNINVYATTAANSVESSYACYYDDARETYLGDVYSVVWMEDSDEEVLTAETLQKQFQLVKQRTNTSHVMQFGDLTIAQLDVSEFQGRKTPSVNTIRPHVAPLDAVRSEDVPLAILHHKLAKATNQQQHAKLFKQIKKTIRNRAFLTNKVFELITVATNGANQGHVLNKRHHLNDFRCYEEVRQYFDQECFDLSQNQYALSVLYTLVNLCEDKVPIATIKNAMDEVCVHPPVYGIV